MSFQELPSRLPSGIFVSSADVAVQFGALPRLGPAAIARAEQGILALAHASSVEVGTGHGVFVCDREQLDACVRSAVAGADAGDAPSRAGGACKNPPSRRCAAAGAALPGPRLSGYAEGSAGEWVLTDSAFHVGAEACLALVAVAAAHPRAFAGVEVCAYGDLMQPMGEDADSGYLGRTDHVASMRSGADTSSADVSQKLREAETKLRRARELLAQTMRGRPLLALPLVPSRFVHVGTMPELLQHCARDDDVLAAFPAPSAGIALGTWDVEKMDPPGTSRMPSVGADGVWGAAPGVGVGSCLMASRVGSGARASARAASSRTATWAGRPSWARAACCTTWTCRTRARPAGHLPALRAARRRRRRRRGPGLAEEVAGRLRPRERPERRRRLLDLRRALRGGRGEEAREEHAVRVPVEAAAVRLGLDPAEEGGVVWAEGEARTTTLARVFPVAATAAEAASAALDLVARVRRGTARQATARPRKKRKARRRALVGVHLGGAARAGGARAGGAAPRRASRPASSATPWACSWRRTRRWSSGARARSLRACRVREGARCARARELCAPAGTKARGWRSRRVALALASSDEETSEAEAIARARVPARPRSSRRSIRVGEAQLIVRRERSRRVETIARESAVPRGAPSTQRG